VTLVAAYVDGGFVRRQFAFLIGLGRFLFLLTTRRIGLVHIHAAMRGSFWRKGLFASIARLFGKPVILHLHGSEMKPFYAGLPRWAQALARRNLEKASYVIALSESWRSFIGEIAPAARVRVLPNYVNIPPLPDGAGRRAGDILFLGLVGDRKGVFDLLPAFASVHEAHPDARLTIGGNGEVERAARMIAELGLGSAASLPGWIDGEAKKALLERASIYILPSHNEGLPVSVLEAMSYGLAVITTRVGGIPELIRDGVDGLLVDAGDERAIGSALDRLLSDDALRERLMTAGRARVEQCYSDKVVLPMLDAIYRDCLTTTSPARDKASNPSYASGDDSGPPP